MAKRPLVVALIAMLASPVTALAASYSYHGDLLDGDAPADGKYDLRVRSFAQPGASKSIGEATELPGIAVRDGRFAVELDLPDQADGTLWVEVAVRKSGSGDDFAVLGAPQAVTKGAATCPGAWALDGNSAIPAGSYLGTADASDLVLKANGTTVATLKQGSLALQHGNGAASGARAVAVNWGVANGVDSFAGGYSGSVGPTHESTFVWGDHSQGTYASTGANQFIAKAAGGIGFNTTAVSANQFAVVAPGGVSINTENTPSPALNAGQIRIDSPSAIAINRPQEGANYPFSAITMAGPGYGGDVGISFVYQNSNGSTPPIIGGIVLSGFSAGRADLQINGAGPDGQVALAGPVAIDRNATANAFEVNGDASKTTAGAWLANSDRRIKSDIAPIPHALDTIMKLRPVTFHYDDAYRAANKGIDTKRYFNVVAQEFAQVFPDAVKGSGEFLPGKAATAENEILQVDTYPAQITAIAAIQELAVEDDALRVELQALAAENAELRRTVDALVRRMARIDRRQER